MRLEWLFIDALHKNLTNREMLDGTLSIASVDRKVGLGDGLLLKS